jgi:hypothetical protein
VIQQVEACSPHGTAESPKPAESRCLKGICPSPLQVSKANDASGLPDAYPCALKAQHTTNQYDFFYAAPTGRMGNTSGNPMRRSLRSLATGWDKCLSGIGFQPAWGFQPDYGQLSTLLTFRIFSFQTPFLPLTPSTTPFRRHRGTPQKTPWCFLKTVWYFG